MRKSGMRLMFFIAMLVSVSMLFGCVKKKTDNTTATVETPTPTPTEDEKPEETLTPTPTVTVTPTATPTPMETVVSAVEIEDTENQDTQNNNTGYTAPSGNSGTSNNSSNSNSNNSSNNNSGNSSSGDSTLVFADDYVDRSELTDEQVGYGSGTVPEASGPLSPGEGNQALISASVYVRSGPGRTNEIIGSLREGDVVIVLGNENGWLKINYGNKVGYFYQEYAARNW